MLRAPSVVALAAALIPAPTLSAQEAAGPELPPGWELRADRGHEAAAGMTFVTMTPGWHLTTGEFSGILYRPDQVASGSYEAMMAVHLFATSPQRMEGFGLFVGGDRLGDERQRYTYFLIRADGKYLVKVRDGDRTSTVADWTASSAIKRLPEGADESTSIRNDLGIQVSPNAITFLINGERVLRRPIGDFPAAGIVGIRANHRLNLHVQALEVARPGVPAR